MWKLIAAFILWLIAFQLIAENDYNTCSGTNSFDNCFVTLY